MTLRSVLLALALLATGGIPAAPPNETLTYLGARDTPFGLLALYGAPPGTSIGHISQRSCGSGDLQCDTENVPLASACANVIAALNANGQAIIGLSPRSACMAINGGQCCVSWANFVPGLTEGELVPAATAAYNECVENGFSGETRQTLLHGICTSQCLSNRPDGCV